MAAHNLAVFYETLGRAELAVEHYALAARLRGWPNAVGTCGDLAQRCLPKTETPVRW